MDHMEQVEVFLNSPVFNGIDIKDIGPLLESLGAVTRVYEAGSYIKRKGDVLDFYPFIVSGRVSALMPDGGQEHYVSEFTSGDSFAEAIPSAIRFSPVNMLVKEKTMLVCIPAARLDASTEPAAEILRMNLKGELAKKMDVLIKALRVLSEPKLSDRVIAYLQTLPDNANGSKTIPFSRSEWAGYLRVADKSLIRELRKMQSEGLIEVNGRTITLL